MEVGFIQCRSNHSVLMKSTTRGIVVLVIYVDDIIVSRSDLVEIEEVKEYMKRQVQTKNLGQLCYIFRD